MTALGGGNSSTRSNSSRKGSNVSVSSISSRISNLSRRSLNAFSLRSTSSRSSRTEEIVWAAGNHGETASLVTMRQDEALESDPIAELPVGTFIEIIEVGEGRRIKVKAGQFEGWISSKTKMNEQLVHKRDKVTQMAIEDFEIGGQHEVKSIVTVRASEALDSEVRVEVKPGSLVKIVEIGLSNKRRAKIVTDAGVEGWISMATKTGELLIGKVSGTDASKGTTGGLFGNSNSKVKSLLESARCGDLFAINKVVDSRGSIVGRLSGKVDLNCSDIRGKTPLIYASAFGHKHIVEYLLSQSEVHVNAIDDTQKSALHHCAKRTQSQPSAQAKTVSTRLQADIVVLLIRHKAYIEARDHNGCTALMFAVANGDEAVVTTLLSNHANVNVRDFEGHTPLDYATNFGHTGLSKTLRSYGATLGEESENGPVVEGVVVDGFGFSVSAKTQTAPEELPSANASTSTSTADTAAPKRKSVAKRKAKPVGDAPEEEEGAIVDSPKKTKPKGKTKSKAKVKPKDKTLTSGMQEMMEAQDTKQAEQQEIAVEETPKEEVVDEAEQARSRALQMLRNVLETGLSVKELQAAIDGAKQADVASVDIQAAEQALKSLKERAKARDELINAIEVKDVAKLKEAIAKAKKADVCDHEIQQAQGVLKVEEPRVEVRAKLKAAENAGNLDSLKDALTKAIAVKLPEDEVSYYQDLLASAESKEKAQELLNEAQQSRDISALKFAIQQGKQLGINTVDAEAVLADEEPKQKARELLAEACEKCDVEAMQAAIQVAKKAGLGEDDYAEAAELVHREEVKAQLLKQVKDVIEDTRGVDTTSMDALKSAKDNLSQVIKDAKDGGVSETLLADAELRRRRIHNGIEDLKGSIRVFCRVRPLSSDEKNQGDTEVTKTPDGMTIEVDGTPFQFDAVFAPGTQEEVFEECGDLIQSAVDGYNVTMFAYGQTGAGKTFTMYGKPGMEGTAPRTIKEIFRVVEQGQERYTYTVMGSMLELYKNKLVDLLNKGDRKAPELSIKTDKAGTVQVEHLTEQECHSVEDLTELLDRGNEHRTTASTQMNSESSRSHLVFMVKIISVNRETKDQLKGKITLCDLAGSERLKKSKVDLDMQKEAIEINKSLTALGDVIEALTKGGKQQIPYRNHKLTQLMQDSLGGSAKTLMFMNCSPANSNCDETLMSLKYAARAKQIKNEVKKVTGAKE